MRSAKVIVFAFSLSSLQSLERVGELATLLARLNEDQDDPILVGALVGCKADLTVCIKCPCYTFCECVCG